MTIKNRFKKAVMLIIASLMIFTSLLSVSTVNNQSVSANDLNLAEKLLCKYDGGRELVRFRHTDYSHYLFRSKSAVTNIQPVDSSWLNKFLSIAGYDFEKVNEEIMGRPLRPKESPEITTKEANESATKVNAFDRFGVSGLKWSSYQGEWKYYHVDPCVSQDKVAPTTFGTFYTGRLEPQSTHNEVSTSIDPRTVQFNKTVGNSFLTAFSDILANMMFSITKTIVTLTIIFVGLAFTDITTVLGFLDSNGNAGASAEGIFTSLFDGLFSGFIIIGIIISASLILYRGLIKREVRFALNSLMKTIGIFIIAAIMASNPSYWVGVPNKAATYGQALILSSMSDLYEDSESNVSLCSTEVASLNINMNKPNSFKNEFEKTNQNMRSMIACNMWQTLLFEPWVKGQFGADYDKLANDKVRNNNEDWVGTASVPVGKGKTIDNWALFHLSTQTNAHVPADGESMSVIINGVNADWWRIVDAMSDYEEEVEKITDSGGITQQFNVPVKKETTQFWQSWVGNNRTERLGTAFISIVFGIVGSLAPLVFGIASAVFGLGVTLFMITSPVFFLFGVIGGSKGDGIFFGWLSGLINTIIKKIIAGLLLILSLVFSMAIMKLIGEIGFIESFILMVVSTTLLIKNKNKVFDMLANVNFGGAFDPRQKANQFLNTQKTAAKEVGKVTASAVGGSIAAHKTGQNIFMGAKTGVQRQLKNKLYTSTAGMNVIRQLDISKDKGTGHYCVVCYQKLGDNNKQELGYRDDNGNYYCVPCSEEAGLETLHEVLVGSNDSDEIKRLYGNENDVITNKDVRSINSTSGLSKLTHRDVKMIANQTVENGVNKWEDENVREMIIKNILDVNRDFVVFKNVHSRLKRRVTIPPTPEPLQEYIDLPLINVAWEQERFDIIAQAYKEAWKRWYYENAKLIEGITEEYIVEFIKEIELASIDITEDEAAALLNDYFENHMKVDDRASDAPLYSMRNGKIRFHKTDI